ncbi:MAG: hypothetical protein Q8Q00_13370 [Dehalococcoidia bacterium]|nr:hypothetical protein [Dehalococcoidia bacterium]
MCGALCHSERSRKPACIAWTTDLSEESRAPEGHPPADPQAGSYDTFSAEPLDVIDDLLDYGE